MFWTADAFYATFEELVHFMQHFGQLPHLMHHLNSFV